MFAMKRHFSNLLAIFLAFSVLSGILPAYAAEAEDNQSNIALGKTVTDSSGAPESEYWSPGFLTDGENKGLVDGNTAVGWTSPDQNNAGTPQDMQIELTIDLNGTYLVSSVNIAPTEFDAGKFFPVAYKISISTDGSAWTEVLADRKADLPGGGSANKQIYSFETPRDAAYVRITITEHRAEYNEDGSVKKYMSQLGEIEVYGKQVAHPGTEEQPRGENVALHKPVSDSSNAASNIYWSTQFLTDGANETVTSSNNAVGWSSPDTADGGTAQNQVIDLVIDLQGACLINEVVLLPTKFDSGKFYPTAYTIYHSTNGTDWTTVGSDTIPNVPSVSPLRYRLQEDAEASFVRVSITGHRFADNKYMSQLGEIEVYGVPVSPPLTDPEPDGTNIALGQKISATSYFTDPDHKQNYAVEQLVDGLRGNSAESSHLGWATKKDIGETDTVTISLELDGIYAVENVALSPVLSDGGRFFPVDYAIHLSEDGTQWTLLDSITGAAAGQNLRQHKPQAAVRTKYIKIVINRHRHGTENGRQLYASRIGEVEVYGTLVQRDAPTINKASLRMAPGSSDQLIIGWRTGILTASIQWASSNEAVASVDASGNVYAHSEGSAIITGTYAGDTVTCNVTVTEDKATDHFMFTAFWPMEKENINQAWVNQMAAAGINNIQLQYSMNTANYDDNIAIIQLAHKAGIGVTVNEKSWGWGDITSWDDARITNEARKYSHIPGVNGYFLVDEPSMEDQPRYYHCFKAFKDAMPGADVHFNFLPYLTGMEELLTSEARPYVDYLMFDAYIYPGENGINDDYLFSTSERVRELGVKYGINTAQYVESLDQSFINLRRPNGSELLYKANAVLAYGVKQIAYFTWRTPTDVGDFGEAVVHADGTPTDLYDTVSNFNNRVLNMENILMNVDALAVYHTGENCGNAYKPVPENFFLQPVSSSSRGLIISYMRERGSGENLQNYVMLVNRDTTSPVNVSFLADADAAPLRTISGQTITTLIPDADGCYKLTLAAGDGILLQTCENFHWDLDEAFIETPAGENAAQAAGTALSPHSDQLTDGARISNSYTDGCGLPGYRVNVDSGIVLTMNFGGPQTLNRVDIYPGATEDFPRDFQLEGSTDGESWTMLDDQRNFDLPENGAYCITFPAKQYRILRLTVTSTISGQLHLCEWEAYNDDGSVPMPSALNTVVPVDTQVRPSENLARQAGVEIICSDSHEPGAYWYKELINDGTCYDAIGVGNAGWSSTARETASTNPPWIGYDLGGLKSVFKIVVYNAWDDRGAKKAECFPSDYAVETSLDGVNWDTVYSVKNDSNWELVGARTLEFAATPARYIRFVGQRMGRCGEGFMMQLSELEVYGSDFCEADKTALNAAINLAESLDQNSYTIESWSNLVDCLATAHIIRNDALASQQEVNFAEAALKEAIDLLILIESPQPIIPIQPPFPDYSSGTSKPGASGANTKPDKPDLPAEPQESADYKPSETPFQPETVFKDVTPDQWFYGAVEYVCSQGLFMGVTSDSFQPELEMSRAMLATVLYRLAGSPDITINSPFRDVNGQAYYADAISWGVDNGIINGTAAGLFSPDGDVTREHIAVFLYRYAVHVGFDVSDRAAFERYDDAEEISEYAREALSWAVATGLLTGRSSNTLAPHGAATRAEVAIILMRLNRLMYAN